MIGGGTKAIAGGFASKAFRRRALRLILRPRAMTILGALLTMGSEPSADLFVIAFTIRLVHIFVLLFASVRLGLLTALVAMITQHFLEYPISLDLAAWPTQHSLAAVAALVALALHGFLASFGGRPVMPYLRLDD